MGFDIIKDAKEKCSCSEEIVINYKDTELGTILRCRQCFNCYKAVEKVHVDYDYCNVWEKLFWRSLWNKFCNW